MKESHHSKKKNDPKKELMLGSMKGEKSLSSFQNSIEIIEESTEFSRVEEPRDTMNTFKSLQSIWNKKLKESEIINED